MDNNLVAFSRHVERDLLSDPVVAHVAGEVLEHSERPALARAERHHQAVHVLAVHVVEHAQRALALQVRAGESGAVTERLAARLQVQVGAWVRGEGDSLETIQRERPWKGINSRYT